MSQIKDIKKKLTAVRSATKADVTKKLAEGLPIASMEDGAMTVEQVVEVDDPHFVTKPVPASEIAVKVVKPAKAAKLAKAAKRRAPRGAPATRKSATAA